MAQGGTLVAEPATAAPSSLVRELFDAKAADWSSKYAPGGRLAGRLAGLALAVEHEAAQDARLLDLGCGTGELSRRLASGGRQVTGCDISEAMLTRAAELDPAGIVAWIPLAPGWRTLPFTDSSFGTVVISSVLEYVHDPLSFLRECARVLEPGGTLLCTVPDMRHLVRWIEGLLGLVVRALPLGNCGHQRLDCYLTYLKVSTQRHPARQWRKIAALTGLDAVDATRGHSRYGALRLLLFRRTR